jgi:hypothetical protein
MSGVRRCGPRTLSGYSIKKKRIADPLQIKAKTENRQRTLDERGVTLYLLIIAARCSDGG